MTRKCHRPFARTASLMFALVAGALAQAPSPAHDALAKCEQSDAEACQIAARSNLPAQQLSEAYTFWADTFPNQWGNTTEPIKLLRKAIALDPNNALANYLLGMYLPGSMNYRNDQEKKKLLQRAAELRPDWEAPHVQLALLALPWGYQKMIKEWTAALKFGPDDPFYAAKLKEAREKFAAQKRDFAETEAKAKVDPQAWAGAAIYSAKFTCEVPKAEEWTAKYNEFHRDGHWPALVLADTYAACGQPEKARAMYRDVVARYEKWVNTDLTSGEAMQVSDQQMTYLDLQPELSRLRMIRGTLDARDQQWWRVRTECEAAERESPTPEIYALHVKALIQSAFPGYEVELQSVLEKALKLDPKFLDEHPEYRSRYKEPAKQ